MLRRILFVSVLLALAAVVPQARAQDFDLNKTAGCQGSFACGGTGTPLQGVPWSSFTQVYLLTPRNPDQGVCIFVANNDSSQHSFTLAVSQTGDLNITNFSNQGGRWVADTVVFNGSGNPSVAANSTVSFYTHTNAAVRIAFQFGGASGAGTADIFIVQTTHLSCGPAGPVTGQGAGFSTASVGNSIALSAASDGLGTAFFGGNSATNPANGAELLAITGNSNSKNIYFDHLVVNTTATAQVTIIFSGNQGTSCTAGSPQVNLKQGSSGTPTSTVLIGPCTTNPGGGAVFFSNVTIQPGGLFSLDLRGLIAPAGTTNGVSVQMAATLTGTISVVITQYEK